LFPLLNKDTFICNVVTNNKRKWRNLWGWYLNTKTWYYILIYKEFWGYNKENLKLGRLMGTFHYQKIKKILKKIFWWHIKKISSILKNANIKGNGIICEKITCQVFISSAFFNTNKIIVKIFDLKNHFFTIYLLLEIPTPFIFMIENFIYFFDKK
jgi:hypothetical protein